MLSYKFLLVFTCFVRVHSQFEGEFCIKDGAQGVCRKLMTCQEALSELRKGKPPQTCSFDRLDPIVCCLDRPEPMTTTVRQPVATTTKRPLTTTTEYIPPEYTYVDSTGSGGKCEPIPASLTTNKTGQKAWDKCIEYQDQLVFPCEKAVSLTGGMSRGYHCHHVTDKLIVGGKAASLNEFTHLALLGYGDPPNIRWDCGGALISEKFVLTAGHCTASRNAGPVKYAFIGALRRSEANDESKRYEIKNIIPHPKYKSPRKYNDIALLELDRNVTLSQFTVPACLYVGDAVDDNQASATGWGDTAYQGTNSEILQKVILSKFPYDECSEKYPAFRHMVDGVDPDTQVCYGDRTMSKDTCQGDSGGPLQIKSTKINCMYVIIAVTSFGKNCGWVNSPGIYTKVETYIPWIESVVWP